MASAPRKKAKLARTAHGFYYWPAVIESGGGYFAVVEFVCIEQHIKMQVEPQTRVLAGPFLSEDAASAAAEAAMPKMAETCFLPLCWIWIQ